MKRTKIILLLVAFLCVGSAAYSQNKYRIKKGETLWDVATAMIEENDNRMIFPTYGEIEAAMNAIAKANGCKDYHECETKFFSDKAIARGSVIMMPSNKKAPRDVEANDYSDEANDYSDKDDPLVATYENAAKALVLVSALLSSDVDNDKPEKKENRVVDAKPKQETTAPKESPSIVTNKTMSFVQMVKRPFGVLPENSKGMQMDEVEKQLAKYSGWQPSKSGIDYDMEVKSKNGYDMRFLNVIPERAECGFLKSTSKSELNRFRYTFRFDKKKDAETFREKVLAELKSIGSQLDDNYYGNVRAKYGSSFIVVSINKDTKQVRVEINYMENGSWLE